MSDALPGIIAQLRRLYHHMLSGAHITPADMGHQIEALEKAQTSVGDMRHENAQLRRLLQTSGVWPTPIPPWAPCKRPLGCDYPDCECKETANV